MKQNRATYLPTYVCMRSAEDMNISVPSCGSGVWLSVASVVLLKVSFTEAVTGPQPVTVSYLYDYITTDTQTEWPFVHSNNPSLPPLALTCPGLTVTHQVGVSKLGT